MTVDKGIHILIVDDMKSMLRIIDSTLRQIGFMNIIEASDGESAFKKMKEEKVDLLLSDWNMQPVSGFELLKKVRADDALKHIPVILITAESKVENIVAAKQAGVNNYIVKPFNANTLKDKLAAVLGKF